MLFVFLLRAYLAINIFIAVCTMESVSIFVTASLISYDFSALMHVYSFEHLKILLCNLIESNQHNVAKCNLDKVKLWANVVSGLLLKRARLWSDRKGLLLFWDLCCISRWHFLGWSLWICLVSESLRILAPSPSLPFCAGEYFHWILSVGGCMQGWFPFAGLPRIPPCYAWCV